MTSNEQNSTHTIGEKGQKENSPGTLNRGSNRARKEVATVCNNMNFSSRLFILQAENGETKKWERNLVS